jgi:hypothetical protein
MADYYCKQRPLKQTENDQFRLRCKIVNDGYTYYVQYIFLKVCKYYSMHQYVFIYLGY